MLTLTTGLSRELKIVKLAHVRAAFSTYFGFTTNDNLITAQNYANQTAASSNLPPMSDLTTTSAGNRDNLRQRFGIGRGDLVSRKITRIFLEGDGMALPAIDSVGEVHKSIAAQLVELFTPSGQTTRTQAEIDNYSRFLTIIYSTGHAPLNFAPGMEAIFRETLNKIGVRARPPSTNSTGNVDSTTNVDEGESIKRLSAFMMKHPILVPSEKNAELLSVFFNAMPTLELTRATPVMNVRMFSKKQIFQSDDNGRLSAVSLPKFLEGAINTAEGGGGQYSVLRALALANQVTSSMPLGDVGAPADTTQDFQNYSVSGMELFQSPQTLVNPDAAKIRNNFLASPIDPFRPLATIKSFDVDVKSTGYGLISTKQSKLEILLHDRSRLGEFADFVKPDRFASGFIEVEYGWIHPDALDITTQNPNDIKNPYADLLNLTRSIDHYSITNSSFTFDEVGQVTIILILTSRGVSEMTELSITGEQNELRAQLEHVRQIALAITQLTAQVYRPAQGAAAAADGDGGGDDNRREIRGHLMLGAAGDAINFLIVTKALVDSYRVLQSALNARGGGNTTPGNNSSRNSAAINLRDKIIQLYGSNPDNATLNTTTRGRNNRGDPENGGIIGGIRRTVNSSIKETMRLMNRGTGTATARDAFFEVLDGPRQTKINSLANTVRVEGVTRTPAERAAEDSELANIVPDDHLPNVISLGTIIMSFVAKPLAGIKIGTEQKFKEVQVYFYTFNPKAGTMSKYNIAQFPVYTKHFAREYSRFRLQTAGRNATVSITDFMNFLHDKIIDDEMNPAYGINSLYKAGREGPEAKDNADTFDGKIRKIMSRDNINKSPDFQMPMLTYDIESCPYVGNTSQTILKIHVVDRTNSPRNPLRELLTLSINDTLSSVSTFPANETSATETIDINEQNIRASNNGHGDRHTALEHANALRKNWGECYREVQQHALSLGLIEDINTFRIDNSGHRTDVASTSAPNYRFVGGSDRLKSMIMEYTPHVIYGAMNSTVKQASLSTQSNASLTSINMNRSGNADAILATGEQAGGVPMQIYPVQLSLTTLGCPFIRYSQELFVDFNTNTTADNLYYVTGIQHKLAPGEFTTTLKLTPNDAFPAYRNFIGQLSSAAARLEAITGGAATATATATATGGAGHGQGARRGHRPRQQTQAQLDNEAAIAARFVREDDARVAALAARNVAARDVAAGAEALEELGRVQVRTRQRRQDEESAYMRTHSASEILAYQREQRGLDARVANSMHRQTTMVTSPLSGLSVSEFQRDEEQRQHMVNQRITEDGAYARYARRVVEARSPTMLTPAQWDAAGRPHVS